MPNAWQRRVSTPLKAVRYDQQPRLPGCWTLSSSKAPCATRLGEQDNAAGTCTLAKVLGGACISPSTFTGPLTGGPSIAESMDNAMQCLNDSNVDKICHELAKPIYSVNMLKIRPRLQSLKTNQPEKFKSEKWKNVDSTFAKDLKEWQGKRNSKAREDDPAAGYDFEGYFHEHRPYMRNWDTAKESMQEGEKPNYWCDWGRNDAIVGVGRDANSMWGSQSKLCRYGGGNGQGDKNPLSCLSEAKMNGIPGLHNGWVDQYPGLAGSEWAELKMYQSRCYENSGLNCLCQYEKVFKKLGAEGCRAGSGGAAVSSVISSKPRARMARRILSSRCRSIFPWAGAVMQANPIAPWLSLPLPVGRTRQVMPKRAWIMPGAAISWSGRPNPTAANTRVLPMWWKPIMPRPMGAIAANPAITSALWIPTTASTRMPVAIPACSDMAPSATFTRRKATCLLPPKSFTKQQLVYTTGCEDGSTFQCVEKDWGNVRIFRPSKASLRSVGGGTSFSIPGFGGGLPTGSGSSGGTGFSIPGFGGGLPTGGGSSGGGGGGILGGLPPFLGPLLGMGQ